MNRKFELASIGVLLAGLSGNSLAAETGTSKAKEKPHGAQTAEQRRAAEPVTPEQRSQAEKHSVRLSSLDKDQVKSIQGMLKDLALYSGEPEGSLSESTRAALSRYFHTQLMLLQKDRIGLSSLSAFGFDQNEIQRVRGVDEQRATERQPMRGYEAKPKAPKGKQQEKPKP